MTQKASTKWSSNFVENGKRVKIAQANCLPLVLFFLTPDDWGAPSCIFAEFSLDCTSTLAQAHMHNTFYLLFLSLFRSNKSILIITFCWTDKIAKKNWVNFPVYWVSMRKTIHVCRTQRWTEITFRQDKENRKVVLLVGFCFLCSPSFFYLFFSSCVAGSVAIDEEGVARISNRIFKYFD